MRAFSASTLPPFVNGGTKIPGERPCASPTAPVPRRYYRKVGNAYGDSTFTTLRHAWAARALDAIPSLRSIVINAGDVAAAGETYAEMAGRHVPALRDRVALWEVVRREMRPDATLRVLEFGVGEGAATRWWCNELSERDLAWFGFDVFTGNPTAWREHAGGVWDIGGNPPHIPDGRITWVTGDVTETTRNMGDFLPANVQELLVLLDMNLVEPTRTVIDRLLAEPLPRTFFYFDDFYDPGQRRLARSLFQELPGTRLLGRCPKGMAFAYEPSTDPRH